MKALPSNPVRAVLFDLDGTLVDTAPDMANALNRLRTERGLPPLPYERIRPQVSNGARAMIALGFKLAPEQPGFETLRQRFLDLYDQDIATRSRPFPGMSEQIQLLVRQGIGWGVVTNKPGHLSRNLLPRLGIDAPVLVAGDDLPRRKPWPDPLIYAAGALRLRPGEVVYLGDHERDVQAGRAAGMPTIAVRWGYLDGERPIEDWGADGIIDHPDQLPTALGRFVA